MSIYHLISLKPIVNRYDWIALLDVDEVIVPRKHKSWSKMMEAVHPQAKDFSRWSFKNIYFLDNMTDNLPEPNLHKDVPAQLHMMNHVYRYLEILSSPQIQIITKMIRSANYTPPGHYIKCFHNTEHVLTLHNHYPTRCLGKQLFHFIGGIVIRDGHADANRLLILLSRYI